MLDSNRKLIENTQQLISDLAKFQLTNQQRKPTVFGKDKDCTYPESTIDEAGDTPSFQSKLAIEYPKFDEDKVIESVSEAILKKIDTSLNDRFRTLEKSFDQNLRQNHSYSPPASESQLIQSVSQAILGKIEKTFTEKFYTLEIRLLQHIDAQVNHLIKTIDHTGQNLVHEVSKTVAKSPPPYDLKSPPGTSLADKLNEKSTLVAADKTPSQDSDSDTTTTTSQTPQKPAHQAGPKLWHDNESIPSRKEPSPEKCPATANTESDLVQETDLLSDDKSFKSADELTPKETELPEKSNEKTDWSSGSEPNTETTQQTLETVIPKNSDELNVPKIDKCHEFEPVQKSKSPAKVLPNRKSLTLEDDEDEIVADDYETVVKGLIFYILNGKQKTNLITGALRSQFK